ncbi:hypothetical protein L6472_05590 [Prevotella sp. E13-17]|uniref:hypothetical protein n=1 Tax=Prevotella sp. E13-17 TaxID=2913616 RepID=UPI001EDBB4DD|nr:hypothetical protein [Prevotella sp. E13-17]UKK52051.1 hypothetical protein L6472_05590 [Prevotella sp. E13-17]
MISVIPENYFSESTLSHLKPQQGLLERYQCRAIDVTLAAKLTLTYGKYHLALLHRLLAMSEEQTTYQQAEQQSGNDALDLSRFACEESDDHFPFVASGLLASLW